MGDKKSNLELLLEEGLRTAVCDPKRISLSSLILSNTDAKDKNTKPPTEEEVFRSVAFHGFDADHFTIATRENHPELFESYTQLAQAMAYLSRHHSYM